VNGVLQLASRDHKRLEFAFVRAKKSLRGERRKDPKK
jgi:hypothetical protein